MKKKKLSGILFCLVMFLMYALAMATDIYDLMMEGVDLSVNEAELLEKKIDQDKSDILSRSKLLSYYSTNQSRDPLARKAKQKHVLWLVQNAPEAEILDVQCRLLNPVLDAEAYLQAKEIWNDHLRKKPGNLKVIKNYAKFFFYYEPKLVEEILKKALPLDPSNPRWPKLLGELYSYNIRKKTSFWGEKNEVAKKALEQFNIAYELSDEGGKELLLRDIAEAAMEANELAIARQYAEKMLETKCPKWNHGNNIHHANLILGRIALKSGNIKEAKQHLIQAGKTHGSPQLNSFGPNMTLAKELLLEGENDVVLEYFKLCSYFWELDRGQLAYWSEAVKKGEMPEFGANCYY